MKKEDVLSKAQKEGMLGIDEGTKQMKNHGRLIGQAMFSLVFVIIAAIIALVIYVVKFLIELTLLTRNLNETTVMVKKDVEPILSELSTTLKHVNSFAQNADEQLSTIRKLISTVLGAFAMFAGKFKFLSGSFMKGFLAALALFRKK